MNAKTNAPIGFVGTMPRDYDEFLGPFFFESYGADLAARHEVAAGGRILETSCGTGISTEYLHRAMPSGVEIVATDVSEPMLAFAKERRGHLDNVRFELADAADLPFEDGSFDAVSSQFGLMFVPDKQQAMCEAHRVLRAGGRIAFNVWDGFDSNPYVPVVKEALAPFFTSDPPTFLDIPWSFGAFAPLEELLRNAGFVDIALERVHHVRELPTSHWLARGMVCGNPSLVEVRERATAPVEEVVDAVGRALGDVFGHAPFRAPLQAVVATATRP